MTGLLDSLQALDERMEVGLETAALIPAITGYPVETNTGLGCLSLVTSNHHVVIKAH